MFKVLFCCMLIYTLFDNHCIAAENDNQIRPRIKRYELYSEEDVPEERSKTNPAEDDEECDSWFQCVMDFFFGAVDVARGRPGGLFTRMMNWVKKGWCHLTNQCEDNDPHPEPSPDFIRPVQPSSRTPVEPSSRPPAVPADVTTPAVEPDAEEVTEPQEVNKDANDVQ